VKRRDVANRGEVEERAMIRTECHTADDALTVEFDATPWLEEADADSIVLLSRQDWSGPAAADALETRPGNERLRELLRYARERLEKESREDPSWPTFTCRLDGTAAIAWLERNRPEIAQQIRQAI
jgi:hypothetical protein